MLFPQLEEKLQASKQALNTATSENLIEQCKQHLAVLAEYRIQLYKLQDLPGVREQFRIYCDVRFLRASFGNRVSYRLTHKAIDDSFNACLCA